MTQRNPRTYNYPSRSRQAGAEEEVRRAPSRTAASAEGNAAVRQQRRPAERPAGAAGTRSGQSAAKRKTAQSSKSTNAHVVRNSETGTGRAVKVSGKKPKKKKKGNGGLIAAIVVVALLLIGAVIVVVMLTKNGSTSANSTTAWPCCFHRNFLSFMRIAPS